MFAAPMLEGKRCLVTGGSRGLGLAICLEFARAGGRVAFTYSQNDEDARDASARMQSEVGVEPLVFKGSVADASHVRVAVAAVVDKWKGVDVLVNNAGIMQFLPIALLDESDWDELMSVNVKGAYLFSRAVLKYMIRARSGCILNIGSFASERMIDSPVHYAASKSALRGFTEALALETGRYNVRVNLLAPGLLDVGFAASLPEHRIAEYKGKCPSGRLGSAEETARTAVFLVSDHNSFMTGAKVVLDGGL